MLNINDIIDMYVNQKCSTYVIAKKYSTYPNKIRRILIKNGIPLNDKSQAQKNALDSGRSKHPTKGTKRSEDVKIKISESVHTKWTNLSDNEKRLRSEKSKQQWQNMSDAEKRELRNSAAKAVREASKNGSKMERFLLDALRSEGYNIVFHKKGLVSDVNLEIDLFIPELKVAIEIDGPSHFFPIWGEENLQRHIKSDAHKTGLLLLAGLVMIRVKHISKNLTNKNKRDILQKIIKELEKIRKKFPPKTKRFIELEVS